MKLSNSLLESYIRQIIKEDYYNIEQESFSIKDIVKLWKSNNKAYDHDFVMYSFDEVWPYREYTWTQDNMRQSLSEWRETMHSMKENGWMTSKPAIVYVERDGDVKVGEGNHRLAIAKILGIKEIPVRFIFR